MVIHTHVYVKAFLNAGQRLVTVYLPKQEILLAGNLKYSYILKNTHENTVNLWCASFMKALRAKKAFWKKRLLRNLQRIPNTSNLYVRYKYVCEGHKIFTSFIQGIMNRHIHRVQTLTRNHTSSQSAKVGQRFLCKDFTPRTEMHPRPAPNGSGTWSPSGLLPAQSFFEVSFYLKNSCEVCIVFHNI